MDGNSKDNEHLLARIQQLELERDELRKDIEQLCMQQAGPSYLVVATRMHFQRTAALEQEIDNLKKKLGACTRDNKNLQEELSEAYRIKSQLADLHGAEVAKNTEMEKQVKFFQSCVAAAFAERDQSIMEAEKAKEKEEFMSQKFNEIQRRLEELRSDFVEQSMCNDALQIDLAKQEEQNKIFRTVVDKFYAIRQHPIGGLEDISWDDKCASLLHDPAELWTFNDSSTSKYICSLEEELERVRSSVDRLQNKLRVGLEIENHLKKKVQELEKKKISSDKIILNRIAELRENHSQHRIQILNLLDEGRSHVKSVVDAITEKVRQFDLNGQNLVPVQNNLKPDESECRDVHMDIPELANTIAKRKGDASEALAQALQEKVAALLLLSQQEERHLLERNVNAALQKKIEELKRNLLQVTNEKVKALMELAQLKQNYQLLQEKINSEVTQGKLLTEIGEKGIVTHERDGRLRNLLKKTYLRRWIGTVDIGRNEAESYLNNEENSSSRRSSNMDLARIKIENATLKESMESLEHLTCSIHRLRLSLLKVKESVTVEGQNVSVLEALDETINEAKLVKTALGSSLPISWSAESGIGSVGENMGIEEGDAYEDSGTEKIDSVSAAGFEMVELLMFAAHILKEKTEAG